MSQENVEIVRRALGAVYRKPSPDFDTINALYHPDHELVSLTGRRLDGRVLKGVRGYRDWMAEIADAWESWDTEVGAIRGIAGDRVLADVKWTATGKRGGVPVEQPMVALVTVKDEKIVRTEMYSSHNEALEAAGLSE